MPDTAQCLLFVERKSTRNNDLDSDTTVESCTSVNENSSASTPFTQHQIHALFPTKDDDHPFYRILAENNIKRIVNGSVAPCRDVILEVVEIHVYVIPKSSRKLYFWEREETDPKSIRIYHASSNESFLQQIFSGSNDVDYCPAFGNNYSFFDYTQAESVVTEVGLKLIESWLAPRPDLSFRHVDGGTLLHFAAEYGHNDLFKLLIKLGADINQKRENGATALHLAAGKHRKYQCKAIVQSLLKLGLSVNSKMTNGATPLHEAAKVGYLDIVKLFLKHGAVVNAKMVDGSTPLHKGMSVGSREIVRTLIEAGAGVNARTEDGTTPLHIAAGLGVTQASLMLYLIQKCGANVNAADACGRTPILCTKKNLPQVMKLLVENGADSNVQSNRGETLLLDTISAGGTSETLDYIVSLRPSVDLEGNQKAFNLALCREEYKFVELIKQMMGLGFVAEIGPEDAKNPAMFLGAIQKGVIPVVRALLKYGVDVNRFHTFSASNAPPLFLALKSRNKEIVQMILDAGGDVNVKRGNVFNLITPLSYAVENSTVPIVELLMAANPFDRYDSRLLERAVAKADRSMIEFLLEEGLDPNYVNSGGQSLTAAAVRYANIEALELLVRFGARCAFTDLTMDRMKDEKALKAFLDHCFIDISHDSEMHLAKLFEKKGASCKKTLFLDSDCAKMLAQHLIKVEVVRQHISTKNLMWSGLYNQYGLRALKRESRVEVERLKVEKVGSAEVTFYDILSKDPCQVACYARNSSIVKTLESPQLKLKFPIYAGVLRGKIFEGKSQNLLLEAAMESFKFLSKLAQLPKLPDDVIMIIVNYLSNKDLFVLRKCSKVTLSV